jgi:hypothetical protein
MAIYLRAGLWLFLAVSLAACQSSVKPEKPVETPAPEKNRGFQITLVDRFRMRLPLGFPKPVSDAKKQKTPFGFLEENQYYTTNSSNRVEQINIVVTEIPPDLRKKLPEKTIFDIEDKSLKATLTGKIESVEKGTFQTFPMRTIRFFGQYKRYASGYGSSYAVEDNIHGVTKTILFDGFIFRVLYTSAGQYDRDNEDIKEFLNSLEIIPPGGQDK